MNEIAIRGDGVAASCCAYLLGKAGLNIALHPLERPRLPAILLGDHALALIRDIFGRADLFQNAPAIRKRMVAWGAGANVLALDHSAIVVSEELLLKELSPNLPRQHSNTAPDWTIFASRPLPAPVEEHPFGSRMASAVAVQLKDSSDPAACWIESLEDGWLFLIPNAPGKAWLLAVGSAPSELLAASRVIREQITDAQPAGSKFPAYPRIVSPLCAEGWLACGTAAMAFDPLCGDGTAHAIREAILASAVIRAAVNVDALAVVNDDVLAVANDDVLAVVNDDVLAHYQARLTAGFRRHLALCQGFYTSGGDGRWWRRELDSIQQGIAWCDRRLTAHGDFRYQLRDFELHPLR